MNLIALAAATNWLRSVRGDSSADYKINKTYEHKIKLQINPFFVAIHVAALQHKVCYIVHCFFQSQDPIRLDSDRLVYTQGIQFTWEQLATDLLHIHNPIIVQPLLDASPDSQTFLETLHEKCVAHFAAWLRDDLLLRYSPSSLLAPTSRAASDTENVLYLPDHLAAPYLRSAMARKLLEYAGRQVQERDSQPDDQTWSANVVCTMSSLSIFSRSVSACV